ncbi:unnamed protein product [Rotaria sp. Silwood1]|nr:unnamed protein product [Rotaria sp. Silwood1]CAF3540287.1 unnamed protein product [Rotaria sp. Silwood1]CAF3566720.1 unnamed protein product [Rotaria sp. Silwood1]CAF3623054.1 unnamed protein product [Rotaria sp. Silwood1]CAF4580441.1 unnamed protein product [Rotaria sp. Silwood1]
MNQIDEISHQFTIYVGIIMYIFGTIGNILNICVFSIWSRSPKKSSRNCKIVRTNNSSLYLLASSIANLIVIIYPLLTRILFDGYEYQVTRTNLFILCKLRYYLMHTFDLISLTCICMATFDRYLLSSRKVRFRELSTRRHRTILIILFIIFLIGFHNISIVIFYDVSNIGHCIIFSRIYLYYYLYIIQIFLHGIIPISFLSIFGLLTFKQLKKIKTHHHHHHHHGKISIDKQLSRMLLLISIAIILSSIPYCIEQCLNGIFIENDFLKSSYFFLYHVISHILYYTNPVSSFYIYYISTPNFRRQINKIIFCKHSFNYVVYYKIKK